jgi:hypothetical protein
MYSKVFFFYFVFALLRKDLCYVPQNYMELAESQTLSSYNGTGNVQLYSHRRDCRLDLGVTSK